MILETKDQACSSSVACLCWPIRLSLFIGVLTNHWLAIYYPIYSSQSHKSVLRILENREGKVRDIYSALLYKMTPFYWYVEQEWLQNLHLRCRFSLPFPHLLLNLLKRSIRSTNQLFLCVFLLPPPSFLSFFLFHSVEGGNTFVRFPLPCAAQEESNFIKRLISSDCIHAIISASPRNLESFSQPNLQDSTFANSQLFCLSLFTSQLKSSEEKEEYLQTRIEQKKQYVISDHGIFEAQVRLDLPFVSSLVIFFPPFFVFPPSCFFLVLFSPFLFSCCSLPLLVFLLFSPLVSP